MRTHVGFYGVRARLYLSSLKRSCCFLVFGKFRWLLLEIFSVEIRLFLIATKSSDVIA